MHRTDRLIVVHSRNFHPTLEDRKILGLNTRAICKRLNESATDRLMKQIDPRLHFSRNYGKLRPYTNCCAKMTNFADCYAQREKITVEGHAALWPYSLRGGILDKMQGTVITWITSLKLA